MAGRVGQARHKVRSWHWYQRWPAYIIFWLVIISAVSWFVERLMPAVKDPRYGVSFSIKYAKELGNDWRANYLALLDDLGIKNMRLMSYWDQIEPRNDRYDFADLDWQVEQAAKHGAKVSLAIGFRQPRWPECHEPSWAKKLEPESKAWRGQLYDFIEVVMKRYKGNPALESWQLENEPKNNWFGGCHGPAPTDRLVEEFNLAKKVDPGHPVWMSLSDEHGLPLGQPVPDAYGFSIYRIVYSTNTPIHFYITYPITDWYHRLRAFYIHTFKDRPTYIHELQLEPWGPAATKKLTIAEQDRSMSVEQMPKNLDYARKTGIKLQYMWGAEWWYWRMVKFNDPGPWNAIKQEVTRFNPTAAN